MHTAQTTGGKYVYSCSVRKRGSRGNGRRAMTTAGHDDTEVADTDFFGRVIKGDGGEGVLIEAHSRNTCDHRNRGGDCSGITNARLTLSGKVQIVRSRETMRDDGGLQSDHWLASCLGCPDLIR